MRSSQERALAEPLPPARRRAGAGVASAYLLLVVAMLSWSGNMIVGRALAGIVPPLGLSLMRWSIAFFIVLPFAGAEIIAKRAVLRRDWRILLLLGLLGVTICNSLSYVGLQWTTALNGALVNSAGPMLTLLAAFALTRERATPWQLAGILLSLGGVLIIVLRGDPGALVALSINRGDIAMLLSVATWSVYTVLLHRRPPELSPVALLAVLFGIGAVTLVPLHLMESWQGHPLPTTPDALLGYLYVGDLSGGDRLLRLEPRRGDDRSEPSQPVLAPHPALLGRTRLFVFERADRRLSSCRRRAHFSRNIPCQSAIAPAALRSARRRDARPYQE